MLSLSLWIVMLSARMSAARLWPTVVACPALVVPAVVARYVSKSHQGTLRDGVPYPLLLEVTGHTWGYTARSQAESLDLGGALPFIGAVSGGLGFHQSPLIGKILKRYTQE